jgi:hypothetical protein
MILVLVLIKFNVLQYKIVVGKVLKMRTENWHRVRTDFEI